MPRTHSATRRLVHVKCCAGSIDKANMLRIWLTAAFLLKVVNSDRLSSSRLVSRSQKECLQFVRYLPSRWEYEWLREAPSRQGAICEFIDREESNSKMWLAGVLDQAQILINLTDPDEDSMNMPADPVWPLYFYHDTCSWTRQNVYVPIEPAVGLLRHPMATPCASEGTAVDVQDRSYLMMATTSLTDYFTGRKLLFDLGTGSSFQSSLSYIVEKYVDKGIVFDEIWAWEAAETSSHLYWQSVPELYVSRLHFYNTYASDQSNPSSPIGIIQRHFRPGDFVVIKLDIDSEGLENNIMNEILKISHMVGEVFFEKHFDAPEMHPYFGTLNTTYIDTLTMFNNFRSAGVRLHYWP